MSTTCERDGRQYVLEDVCTGGRSVSAYSNFLEHTSDSGTEDRSSARTTGIQGIVLSGMWNASCKAILETDSHVERQERRGWSTERTDCGEGRRLSSHLFFRGYMKFGKRLK